MLLLQFATTLLVHVAIIVFAETLLFDTFAQSFRMLVSFAYWRHAFPACVNASAVAVCACLLISQRTFLVIQYQIADCITLFCAQKTF
jgi:hypothetical protein